MRWIWIDRFTKFDPGKTAQAVKNVSLAEEHLHDHFPGYPLVPHALIIEGMAQTAGILVCQARDFQERVVLAKIVKATFEDCAIPGDVLCFTANVEQVSEEFAVTTGDVTVSSPSADNGRSDPRLLARIELMFSHLDQNVAGKKFPDGQFVMTEAFNFLLREVLPSGGNSPTTKTDG